MRHQPAAAGILLISDLGIRTAVRRLHRLDHLPTPREVEEIGVKWRPNRTLASLYLWSSNAARAQRLAWPLPNNGTVRRVLGLVWWFD